MKFKSDAQRKACFANLNGFVKFSHLSKRDDFAHLGCGRFHTSLKCDTMSKFNRFSDKSFDSEKINIFGRSWNDIQRRQQGGSDKKVVRKDGDYGADPLGDGTFRMVPSGDVVSHEERNNRLKRVEFSENPDYSLDTWQKTVAGVPKYKIDQYYRGIWDELKPQFKGRNVLVRYKHGGQQIVRRHPPGSSVYTTIEDVDDLSNIVREHGVELLPETSHKGDLNRGDIAVLDIDNLKGASEKDMKDVTKLVYDRMDKSFSGKPYIINTRGGYHVGVKLNKAMPYKTMRNKIDKDVIEPVEEEVDGLVSSHHGNAPIYLDKTPEKLHGSTKAIGSLNLPDLVISEKIDINNLGSFKREYLK